MDALLILVTIIGGLMFLALQAATRGVDSRDGVGDDWSRQIHI